PSAMRTLGTVTGRMAEPKILTMVLAGGEGKRLAPLTADRAKPAVPFGGHYRIVDFALSNMANAGYLHIVVLTHYKSHSLDQHIATGAGVTVAGIRAPRSQSNQLGVIGVGEGTKIASFREKPAEAPGLADAPDEIFASMGNYVFTTKTLIDIVSLDAEDQNS